MSPTFPHTWLLHPTTDEYKAMKRASGKCQTYRCTRKQRAPGRTQCNTCNTRLKRLRNPLAYAFRNLKASAAKRGIGFELTFEEFKEFCDRTGYVEKRGKEPHSLSVDRIHNHLPYHKDNIRPMGYLDNCSHKFEVAPGPAEF